MRLTINQHNLSKGLGIVSRAVSSRTTMPVLSNILLATDGDDRLKLSATNREIAITCWIGWLCAPLGLKRSSCQLSSEKLWWK